MEVSRPTRSNEMEGTFLMFDDLRRRMDRMLLDVAAPRFVRAFDEPVVRPFPMAHVSDDGARLVVRVDVPGLTEKDVKITLDRGVLTVSGERPAEALEGYATHRRERSSMTFAKSFTLPCEVDADQTKASLEEGVLIITLAKPIEAAPRQIAINAN